MHAAARREISLPGVTAHQLDFTDREALDAFAAQFEHVDALIVAAGANIPKRRLHELTYESWDHLIGANLTGPANALLAFLPKLKGGTVVIIGSVSGSFTDLSGPAYQAAKAGVLALTRGAGFEVGGDVRCTAILPGVVDTRDPRQPARAAVRGAARADAPARGRRGGVRVRREPAAARVRARADDPAYGVAGDREDDLRIVPSTT